MIPLHTFKSYLNSAAGLCDKSEHSIPHCLMIIVTDLSKAVDADMLDMYADIDDTRPNDCTLRQQLDGIFASKASSVFTAEFMSATEDTVEYALASTVLRAMTMAIDCGVDISDGYKIADKLLLAYPNAKRSFVENAWQLNKALVGGPMIKDAMYIKSLNIIRYIELWCEMLDIDIWWHVQAQLRSKNLVAK